MTYRHYHGITIRQGAGAGHGADIYVMVAEYQAATINNCGAHPDAAVSEQRKPTWRMILFTFPYRTITIFIGSEISPEEDFILMIYEPFGSFEISTWLS